MNNKIKICINANNFVEKSQNGNFNYIKIKKQYGNVLIIEFFNYFERTKLFCEVYLDTVFSFNTFYLLNYFCYSFERILPIIDFSIEDNTYIIKNEYFNIEEKNLKDIDFMKNIIKTIMISIKHYIKFGFYFVEISIKDIVIYNNELQFCKLWGILRSTFYEVVIKSIYMALLYFINKHNKEILSNAKLNYLKNLEIDRLHLEINKFLEK